MVFRRQLPESAGRKVIAAAAVIFSVLSSVFKLKGIAMKKNDLGKIFAAVVEKFRSTPDKALSRAVKADNPKAVRKALEDGANVNALHSIWIGPTGVSAFPTTVMQPIFITAFNDKSAEVVAEMLKFKPEKVLKVTEYVSYDIATHAADMVRLSNALQARETPLVPNAEYKARMVDNYLAGREINPEYPDLRGPQTTTKSPRV